jgi:hypothetical protein
MEEASSQITRELMMPIIRTLGGDRQDSLFEGALQIYMGRKFFVQFLHEELCSSSKENILQTNMFIVLGATKMIAQLHIASIVFIAVVVPMRLLAGKMHKLAHSNTLHRFDIDVGSILIGSTASITAHYHHLLPRSYPEF